MNKVVLAVIILGVMLLACASSAPKTADDYMKQYGGNPDTYSKILSMTDCHLLQAEFDIAYANHERAAFQSPAAQSTLGYLTAAENRMHEMDCYK